MLVIMRADATQGDRDRVVAAITAMGGEAHQVAGPGHRLALAVTGEVPPSQAARIAAIPGVAEVVRGGSSYHLASREWHPEPTVVRMARGITLGGPGVVLIAGPCAVESERQLMDTAHAVAAAGGQLLRGGAYKPRTSPYSFQGLGREALDLLARARRETGLLIV